MRIVRWIMVALSGCALVLGVACGSGPGATATPAATSVESAPREQSPVVIEKQVTVVVTASPGPSATPVVVERQVEVVATPTAGPSPTPVVIEKQVEVEVVVTPTATATPRPAPTATPEPETRTVTDDFRREVEIPYAPQRVAVTNAWMVEALMECGHVPVARPDIPLEFVYPPEAHDIQVVAVSHATGPNLEQLAVAAPDLVITSPTYGRFAEPIQAALGIPVLVYDVTDVQGVLAKIELFGELVGCEETAAAAVSTLRERIAGQTAGLPDRGPRVFAIFGTAEEFLAFTPGSYLGSMIEMLGGDVITRGDPAYVYRGIPDPAFTPLSLEKAVERDPDVILVMRHGGPRGVREESFRSLFSNPAWSGLRAVEEGRVHEVSEWLYLRYPGPRVVWALQELRPLLYPDEGR